MSEEELIKGCIKGERTHFNRLYEKYSSGLYSICLRYADDQDEAKDILQESFVKIFKKLDTYVSEKGTLGTWLKSVVRNQCIDVCRKKKFSFNIPVDQLAEEISCDDEESLNTIIELSYEDLITTISELPVGYRMVFNLYVMDEKSHKEIAAELNISESTSKTQLMKAKLLLQKKLKNRVFACTK